MNKVEKLGQRMAADGKPGEEIRHAQGFVAGDRGGPGSMSAGEEQEQPRRTRPNSDDAAVIAYCGDNAARWAEMLASVENRHALGQDLLETWFANAIETACHIRRVAYIQHGEVPDMYADPAGYAIQAAERKVRAATQRFVDSERKSRDMRLSEEFRDLLAAVDELNALTAPAGVDPQTLQPGKRFKFVDHPADEETLIMAWSADRSRCWYNPETSWVGIFCDDDRVIPEPEE